MHTANRASTEPFPAFSGFSYRPVLPYEAGVSRRDPSPVLRAGGRYYVWYSRSTHDASGYHATIWYATSTDGLHWVEHGQALGRGPRGAFDEHAVFTPTVMVAEDCYWLYYTAVPEPFHNAGGGPAGTATRIGVASAAHPEGPWQRAGTDPILQPSATAAHFDSHRVDDSCLVRRGGEYRLVPLRGVSDRRLYPFMLQTGSVLDLFGTIVEKVIRGDLPAQDPSLTGADLANIEQLLKFVGRSPIDGINYTSLARNLAITKHKAAQYVGALERAFLLRQAFPAGANVLREPKVFMEPPYRLLSLLRRLHRSAARGLLRPGDGSAWDAVSLRQVDPRRQDARFSGYPRRSGSRDRGGRTRQGTLAVQGPDPRPQGDPGPCRRSALHPWRACTPALHKLRLTSPRAVVCPLR